MTQRKGSARCEHCRGRAEKPEPDTGFHKEGCPSAPGANEMTMLHWRAGWREGYYQEAQEQGLVDFGAEPVYGTAAYELGFRVGLADWSVSLGAARGHEYDDEY